VKVTYAYNDANELTSMSRDGSATVTFTYDDWGRTVSKYTANDSTDYEYRYGAKLYSVTSAFPDEGTVTYNYGGDGKRRSRTYGSTVTFYLWDAGWNVINEMVSNMGPPALTNTYVHGPMGIVAHVEGSSPSTGDYQCYFLDNLGSTRALYDDDTSNTSDYEYTPYGGMYAAAGSESTTRLYTGHDWDGTSQLYFAPYRFYNPYTARWMTRDPLGMVDGPNVYAYVLNNPVSNRDVLGGTVGWIVSIPGMVSCVYGGGKFIDPQKVAGAVKCIQPDKCNDYFVNCSVACACLAGLCHGYIEVNVCMVACEKAEKILSKKGARAR